MYLLLEKAMFLCHINFWGGCISLQSTHQSCELAKFFCPGRSRLGSINCSLVATFKRWLLNWFRVSSHLLKVTGEYLSSLTTVNFKLHIWILINLLGSTCDRQTSNRATKSVLPLSAWVPSTRQRRLLGPEKDGTPADSGSNSPWWLEELLSNVGLHPSRTASSRISGEALALRLLPCVSMLTVQFSLSENSTERSLGNWQLCCFKFEKQSLQPRQLAKSCLDRNPKKYLEPSSSSSIFQSFHPNAKLFRLFPKITRSLICL